MDLHALSDSELSEHLNAVLAEQERRQRLATIPATVAELAAQYRSGGGEQAALITAIEGD
ncbi:hypothetical protein LAROYE_30 [Arthrobacter phage Laroye]|uniref:Uncharacterized protein n=2 Tax=Laroyevirus TaxID=1982086 RepID=A0A222ZIM1_9CAUD|nr:hypothetical protein FDH64_gp30 [Arthrobacter phage Laroye]YP_010082737.1 hypothetical protein KMD23_gp29 [Arthrobacter phage Wheelbite]ALY09557.1 hypothetical protein LAROYE_30 [Arthrobacter phage Laroye]ASR84122.1 hypothetical protein SEA_WHEELBITE_29 [Arthrobacter phage Wheelbite]